MKERPIIFSAPMVRAILDGRKTQTRRVVKLTDSGRVKESGSPRNWHLDDPNAVMACPYGVPGDRLWVRETWHTDEPDLAYARAKHEDAMSGSPICYAADAVHDNAGCIWRPSIHMPRWASRITLEIVSVRVERVQEINIKDARKEGCHSTNPVVEFMRLWDSINAKRAPWSSNPWVWVIEFRRVGE